MFPYTNYVLCDVDCGDSAVCPCTFYPAEASSTTSIRSIPSYQIMTHNASFTVEGRGSCGIKSLIGQDRSLSHTHKLHVYPAICLWCKCILDLCLFCSPENKLWHRINVLLEAWVKERNLLWRMLYFLFFFLSGCATKWLKYQIVSPVDLGGRCFWDGSSGVDEVNG